MKCVWFDGLKIHWNIDLDGLKIHWNIDSQYVIASAQLIDLIASAQLIDLGPVWMVG
jgi:hypothetical protein